MPLNVLAIDIGSTRLKAALLDAAGRSLSSAQQASPLLGAQVDPETVLHAAAEAGVAACAGVRPDAIAITGATRTTVFADTDGAALGDVVKLDDGRGAQYQQLLQQAYGSTQAPGFGAFHPLARALDLRDHDPLRYGRTRWLLELKDWINLRLTGRACTDSVALARIAAPGRELDAVLDRLGLKTGLCAPAQDPACGIAPLQGRGLGAWERWQGVPVVQCGFDAWCASFGMGCVQEGAVYNVCGTTEVFGSFEPVARSVPGVSSLLWGNGLYHLGGPCQTGLNTLAWFGQNFLDNPDPRAVLDCAAQAGADTPLCVPFVSGERMPFWRPELRASFIGVHGGHGRPEFARALVDGLLVFQRRLLRLLADAPRAVYLSGGGVALPGWAELKASAFDTPVRLSGREEPGLLGAAMCALVALDVFPTLATAQTALAGHATQVLPDARITQRLREVEPRLLPHFPPMPLS